MRPFLICLFVVVVTKFEAQTVNDSSYYKLFKEVVYTLAHDSLKGRATGSAEEYKSLNYISRVFKSITGQKLSKQIFLITLNDSTALHSCNGYYYQNNHKRKTIIIGAHYDLIGMGGILSKSAQNNVVHNGADDNASGVALLLGVAKKLMENKKTNFNYLFVFYSGHEIGLYGSSAFSEFATRKTKNIDAVINFDMVGRMDADLKKLTCMYSQNFDSIIKITDPEKFGFELRVTQENKLEQLDTKSFYQDGIPCINFTTGVSNDYHKTTDDAVYINYWGMVSICNYIYTFLTRNLTCK